MDFTEEQLKAVNYAENKSAAVSASAGSGKTAVLVEHIARLISDKEKGVPADKIAAMTFTEKAAAELRQRLEKRVKLLMTENPGDEFFRDQLVRLSCAHISTISSFCLDIIRENDLYLSNLPNDFNVCDETKAGELSAKAMKAVLNHIYENFSDRRQYLCARLLGDEAEIAAKIKQLHEFLSNLPDPKEWKERQTEIYSSPDLFREEYTKKAAELFVGYLDEAAALQYELTTYFDEKETAKLAEKLDNAVEALKELREPMLDISDLGGFQSMENLLEKVPPVPTLKSPFNKDNFLRKLTEKIDSCKKIGKLILSAERDRTACLEQLVLLIELEEIYDKEFRLVKEKEGLLDFSDIERYALKVLSLEECKNYGKNNFDYIIVDEFQDSNDIQYEIFKKLSKEGKNLYLVGDVKQSIYGFRNANPDIFAGLFSSPEFNTLLLNSNFRSSDDVIETVNLCFGQAFELSKSAKTLWQDMKAGRGIKKSPKNKSEIAIINSIGSDSTREPLYIAKRISKMVKSGFTVHNKDNSTRPCGYGDFAVLLRNNSYCAAYRKVFEECGIPCVSVGDKAFTDLAEVKNAMAILETVLHPADDLSAAAAMMCPAYGFTAEEMAQLKLLNDKQEYQSLYKSLSQGSKLSSPLGAKAKKFLSDMRLFRKTAVNSVTEELIRTIYSRTNLDRLMAVGAKGQTGTERRENLRLLLHYAKNYPVANDFVSMMKNIGKNKLEMPQAVMSEEAEKMVKIMTIHGSKGLQFPVVFLAGTNGNAPKTEKSSPFIFSKETGAGITISDCTQKYTFNTLSHQLLVNAQKDKEQAEELRLLYVALTRAEEKLIITAKATLRNGKEGYDEDAFPVWQMGNIFSFFYDIAVGNPNVFEMKRIKSFEDCTPEIDEALKEKEEKNSLPDFEAVKKRLEYKYPYAAAVKTPAKFTATALGVVTEEKEENTVSTAFYMGLPLFMKEGHSLTPKERGDLYHKVMEKLDFVANSAEKELMRLEKEGEITAKEREEVNPKEIQAFLDSPLAKRAAAAEKVYREFPLFTTINAAGEENPAPEDLSFIQGVADMFIIENNEIILADYKTNQNITEEKLIKEYKGQLKIYKKALEEMLGLKVKECFLFSFSLKKEIPVDSL